MTKSRMVPLLVIAMLALAMLACDEGSIFDEGITTVCRNGEELVAFSPVPPDQTHQYQFPTTDGGTGYTYYANYVHVSRDGGMMWRTLPDVLPAETRLIPSEIVSPYRGMASGCGQSDKLTIPELRAQLRWIEDERIEISTDQGATWQTDYDLAVLRQEVRAFYHNIRGDESTHIISQSAAPVSALYDKFSGNVLFAMGFNGILLRDPQGEYHWVQVGSYALRNLSLNDLWTTEGGGDDYFSTVLGFHVFLLAALAALVLVSTIALIRRSGWFVRFGLAVGWLGWAVLVIISRPEGTLDAIAIPGMLALGLTVIPALPMTIWALHHYFSAYISAWKAILATALLANIAFMLPIVMWTQGIISAYLVAAGVALLATAGVLAFCYDYFVPRLPEKAPEKPKRKNDEISKPKNDAQGS